MMAPTQVSMRRKFQENVLKYRKPLSLDGLKSKSTEHLLPASRDAFKRSFILILWVWKNDM